MDKYVNELLEKYELKDINEGMRLAKENGKDIEYVKKYLKFNEQENKHIKELYKQSRR